MSSPRDDRYFGSLGKPRRSPPGGDNQSGGFFQTGQVPLTYSTQYAQQRSATAQPRSDHNPPMYGQWSGNAPAQQPSSFPSYEHDTRYPTQPAYPSYPSRTSPNLPGDPHGSRKLPPLHMAQATGREDRWQTTAPYPSHTTQVPTTHNIRSPTASYPPAFSPYPVVHPSTSYSYPPVPEPRPHTHSQQVPMGLSPTTDRMVPRVESHITSPYTRNPPTMMSSSYATQSEISAASEEPVIKKKRKRADAAQLKVLNDTYNRTAFPSTEERAELARKLDMSARSVQIWFQNKRQSMRQTSRQSSSAVTSGSHQPFSMSQSNAVPEDIQHVSGGYGSSSGSMNPGGLSGSSYMPRLSPGSSHTAVSHSGQTPPPHRRRSPDLNVDPRKWTGRGY